MNDEENNVFPKSNDSKGNPKFAFGVLIQNGELQEEPDGVALKRLFTVALETRNFEISQLVQRNNFFMIFQGVLLAGMIQSSHSKPVVSFLVCLAGLVVALCQIKMAAGAKFWQEYWEAALQDIEKELIKHLSNPGAGRAKLFHLFHDDDHIYGNMVKGRLIGKGIGLTQWLVMKRFSVSRVPIYVAVALSAIWALLLLSTMRGYPPFSVPSFVVGF
ncbi:hypothetical protein [Comamonas testosteroni]|uniref:RipA family octameric membrane protein n=1 Tax=Comamonas testosteroni TaxID=285 RepID=UPI002E0E25AC|nr:hypothetical protein U0024_15600 [Comamonas testosteroni]